MLLWRVHHSLLGWKLPIIDVRHYVCNEGNHIAPSSLELLGWYEVVNGQSYFVKQKQYCGYENGINRFKERGVNINFMKIYWKLHVYMISMVSCQKGPTRHAYAWQIGPFWKDTLDIWNHPQNTDHGITDATTYSCQYAWSWTHKPTDQDKLTSCSTQFEGGNRLAGYHRIVTKYIMRGIKPLNITRPIQINPTLVQIMVWLRTGDKSLAEPKMALFADAPKRYLNLVY